VENHKKRKQVIKKWKKETMKKPKDSYICPHCGYVLPKKEAKVSGWDSQSSLSHIHCPKCEKIITHSP